MNVLLLGNKTIHKLKLPSRVEGSFFLTDPITGENILLIEAFMKRWYIKPSNGTILKNCTGEELQKTIVNYDDQFILNIGNRNNVVCFTRKYDSSFKMYMANENDEITFGRSEDSNIKSINAFIKNEHFKLKYTNSKWELNTKPENFVYVNKGLNLKDNVILNEGDTLFVYGFAIVVSKGFIFINNPSDLLDFSNFKLKSVTIKELNVPYEEVKEVDLYKDEDYFFNTPRIRRFIETYELSLANPPSQSEPEELPLLLVLGPMLTMAFMSVMTAANTISSIVSGQTTFAKSWMRLISPIIMLTSSLLWPNITKKYNKKKNEKKAIIRKEKYLKYLEEKQQEIIKEKINQSNILKENFLSLKECYDTIITKKRTLWEKKISQRDFLSVRIGLGDSPIDIKINFNDDEFVIEKDPLKEVANKMVDDAKMLQNVPITFSFFRKIAVAIMGKDTLIRPFINNVLLQILAYHSYDELKIVVFTNENNKSFWEIYKNLPYMFSDDRSIRFFSSDSEGNKELSAYLEQEFYKRQNSNEVETKENEEEDEETNQKESYTPYYLIITDDYLKIRKLGICDMVFNEKENFGFTFIIMDDRLSRLPSSCTNFIMLDKPMSSTLKNDGDNYSQTLFYDEIDDSFDMKKCVEVLSNIPIEFEQDLRYLPTTLGLLEMYKVGKIEQLNIFNRWKLNDPTKSLRVPIGVNDQSNIIWLDLHEKYHGPHGLIAGTTGSGKSEFIITYILSMAINYSPNEVSFILIDYKGGGLAGAFENKKNKVRLPHLAGTITNLDKNELNRTLVSIQSELKRRQSVFNEVRDYLGESTIDIYKYQKFFREGRIEKPMPHLFIVCDEFAELKVQQPDFMDNLISAARIGRSLGVHLILATQKPSGVVNDQIWSNTKFRVCLKVAEKSDSNEVIKRPDAAEIKNAGRFFLQVGYNEMFVLGQSAWAGISYFPSDEIKKEYDRTLSFIDDLGYFVKSVSNDINSTKKKSDASGDELSNVLKYICDLSEKENVKSDTLWLESLPSEIYLNDLIEKYNYNSQSISAVIGEYDDPASQLQNLLTLSYLEDGNTIIYGLSGNSREMLLRTLIYSSCEMNSSEDINFYILDFGSETFKIFEKIPHVGDVVFSSEAEKIEKLFKLIGSEIIKRKELFVEYNGEFKNFCENSGKKVPLYVIVINNFDTFRELYPSYDELVIKLCRESRRYGILFVVLTTSKSGLYSRFLKSFENQLVLDMNNKEEYMEIIGKIGNTYPADYVGRGLVKKENVYEFQTALICDDNNLNEFIKSKTLELSENNEYNAKRIPILPEVVELSMVQEYLNSMKKVPLGISKETLEPYFYDFLKNTGSVIVANEIESCGLILKSMLRIFKSIGNIITVVFDFYDLFVDLKSEANSYCHNNFTEFLHQIILFVKNNIENSNYNIVLFILGIQKYKENIPMPKIEEINRMLKKVTNARIIFVDGTFNFKKNTMEPWVSEVISFNDGIWVGNGLYDQNILKVTNYTKKHSIPISNEFAWVIKNGKSELVKLVNCEGQDEK